MLRKLRIAFLLHNSSKSTLITCSEQNLYLMETILYKNGVFYLRWQTKNGKFIEAVKEIVDLFGKEYFEEDFERYLVELDTDADGISYEPDWAPSQAEIETAIQRQFSWMRDMEIM